MALSAFRNLASTKPRENLRFDAPSTTSSSHANKNVTTTLTATTTTTSSEAPMASLLATGNRNNYNSLVNGDRDESPNDVSLMSTNNLLLQQVKQQEQKFNNMKHYEKYLEMSPRLSSNFSPPAVNSYSFNNMHEVSSDNIDEILKDYRNELSNIRSLSEANDKSSFQIDVTPNRSDHNQSDYRLDTFMSNTRNAENEKESRSYLYKHGDGLLKDLDFSVDKSLLKPYPHFDEDPTSPIRIATETPGKGLVSPSPFTKLKKSDARDFMMSPIIQKPSASTAGNYSLYSSTLKPNEPSPGSIAFTNRQKKYDFDYQEALLNSGKEEEEVSSQQSRLKTRSDTLFDTVDDSININNSKAQISSSAEAALRLENIQLRNEVSKLSSQVIGMQSRMKDLEAHVDQILQLVLNQKK